LLAKNFANSEAFQMSKPIFKPYDLTIEKKASQIQASIFSKCLESYAKTFINKV